MVLRVARVCVAHPNNGVPKVASLSVELRVLERHASRANRKHHHSFGDLWVELRSKPYGPRQEEQVRGRRLERNDSRARAKQQLHCAGADVCSYFYQYTLRASARRLSLSAVPQPHELVAVVPIAVLDDRGRDAVVCREAHWLPCQRDAARPRFETKRPVLTHSSGGVLCWHRWIQRRPCRPALPACHGSDGSVKQRLRYAAARHGANAARASSLL